MIIVEGGDYAGKTTLVNELKRFGIYDVKDRDKDISCEIVLDKDIYYIANILISKILKKYKDDDIFVLYNCNKNDINIRRMKRNIEDEYDKYAYEYNLIYRDVFKIVSNYCDNVKCINTESKDINKIIEMIM